MLGDDLLVAPVFSASGQVSFYLPAGRWTHVQTGAILEGPRWVEEQCGFDVIPVYVRPGAVLAVGAVDDRADYDFADNVTLQVFELADGARVTTRVPDTAGELAASFTTQRDGDVVTVRRTSGVQPWNVVVAGRSAELNAAEESCLISLR
jgi:alpha-D-xyloside xylohydrolase